MKQLTASQIKTLAVITALTINGPLDVTYKVKGVNSASLFCLEEMGLITITRVPVANRNYPDMFATVN